MPDDRHTFYIALARSSPSELAVAFFRPAVEARCDAQLERRGLKKLELVCWHFTTRKSTDLRTRMASLTVEAL